MKHNSGQASGKAERRAADGRRPELPRLLLLALFSATLMILAVPNELFKHGSAFLGLVALAPLYVAVIEIKAPKRAALVVGLFGAVQHAGTSFWLWNFHDYRFWTLGSTTAAYFLVYALLGLYLWLFLSRSGKARPAAFALLWTGFEYCKSVGFLGYPWGLLPYSFTDALPFLQIAELTGVYGLSLILASCNAALAELILGIGPRAHGAEPCLRRGTAAPLARPARLAYAALALVLTLGDLGYGLARLGEKREAAASIDAVIVQQDTDPWQDGDEEASLAANVALARKAIAEAPTKPELVIFSETSLRRPYAEFRGYFEKHPASDPLIPFIRETGAWLFTGAPVVLDWQSLDMTNSALLIDPRARLVKSYAKVHMVPFAEVIPFWEVPAFRAFMQKAVGLESGWTMGGEHTVFELPTKTGAVRFGAPICFEDAFPDDCREFSLRGADILVNLTNISWSLTDSAEIQHWASARFRAIEARKTLVRSTNGGVSCVVGPRGDVLMELPLFTPAASYVRVPVFRSASPTLYIAWGDWLPRAALLLSAALTIILGIGNFKSKRS